MHPNARLVRLTHNAFLHICRIYRDSVFIPEELDCRSADTAPRDHRGPTAAPDDATRPPIGRHAYFTLKISKIRRKSLFWAHAREARHNSGYTMA